MSRRWSKVFISKLLCRFPRALLSRKKSFFRKLTERLRPWSLSVLFPILPHSIKSLLNISFFLIAIELLVSIVGYPDHLNCAEFVSVKLLFCDHIYTLQNKRSKFFSFYVLSQHQSQYEREKLLWQRQEQQRTYRLMWVERYSNQIVDSSSMHWWMTMQKLFVSRCNRHTSNASNITTTLFHQMDRYLYVIQIIFANSWYCQNCY